MKNFPHYQHDADVACFNCGTSLSMAAPQDKGYAPGTGQFRKTCTNCGYHTYYDLAPPAPPELVEGGVS